jgi:diguanylate cyclase (GGDEF)-like protein
VLLVASAAWIEPGVSKPLQSRAVRIIAIPAAAALVAICIQAAERFTTVPTAAAVISLLTLIAVVARLVLSLRESQGEVRSSVRESRTDELTGLPNRRALMLDLERAVTRPPAAGSLRLLALYDLDGFKLYNDTFGHPAGDALLERLGGRLERFAASKGRAYRLGGDEFCLLAECTAAEVDAIIAGANAALSERGEGFAVAASQGSVLLPSEAGSVKEAMQLADRRMYANKVSERTSAGSQSRDVLLTALRERQPQLAEQAVDVAELALAVAEELGMEAEQRDETYRRDPEQARPARGVRVGVRPPAHPDRRADHLLGGGARAGRASGSLERRALGWGWLSGLLAKPADPTRLAGARRLRRLRGDGLRASLQRRDASLSSSRRATPQRRLAV